MTNFAVFTEISAEIPHFCKLPIPDFFALSPCRLNPRETGTRKHGKCRRTPLFVQMNIYDVNIRSISKDFLCEERKNGESRAFTGIPGRAKSFAVLQSVFDLKEWVGKIAERVLRHYASQLPCRLSGGAFFRAGNQAGHHAVPRRLLEEHGVAERKEMVALVDGELVYLQHLFP